MGMMGLGLAIFTAGASIAAAGGVIAAIESASAVSLAIGTAGVVSDVTAIASGATEESNPQASSILGWVSLGAGTAGLGAGVYDAGRAGYRGLNKLTEGLRLRLGNIRSVGLSGRGASAAGRAMSESMSSVFTNAENISRARNIPFNFGIGNCEFVAQRAFSTLLTGVVPSGFSNFFTSAYETIYGVRNALDNCYPFRRIAPPAERYEAMLRELSPVHGPFPEVSSVTFSSRAAMIRKLNEAHPFSVFWASSTGRFMGINTSHAFVVVRGADVGDYYIFDKYSAYSHFIAMNHPDNYFETFFDEFEVELTGFWNRTHL